MTYQEQGCDLNLKLMQLFFSVLVWTFPGIPGGSDDKDMPVIWETQVQSLSWKDPLEKGIATHSSILAWRIPNLAGHSPWGHRVRRS